jgi:hypothetical protein
MDSISSALLGQSFTTSYEQQTKMLIAASEANIARIESQIKDLLCLRDRERGVVAALKLVIAPIRKLPPELLVEIFLHAFGRRASIKDALKICRVCAYWKQLACRTPALWTRALAFDSDIARHSPEKIAAIKIWLERSAPLAIPIRLRIHFSAQKEKALSRSLVDVQISVASRWGRVEFDAWMLPALAGLAPGSLAQLKDVTLADQGRSEYYPPAYAFLGAPHLRRVTLAVKDTRSLPMPWPQLTRLVLTDRNLQLCLDILVQCTAVVMVEITTEPWDHSPPPPTVMATLPCLENLELRIGYTDDEFHSSKIFTPFFAPLALPSLKTLFVGTGEEFDWSIATFNAFQIRSPNIENLWLASWGLGSDDLHSILLHAPSLLKLETERCMHCIDHVLLGELTYSELDAVQLTPRLQTLSLHEVGDLDENVIQKMVQSRWWSDPQLQALAAAPAVARWKRVGIWRGDDYEHFSRSFKFAMDQYKLEGLDVTMS